MIESHAWNERLDLAHEAMDHEHHLQIALVSAFVDAVEQGRPWLARRLAGQLLRYSVVHFASEELLMDASGYSDREPHAAEHAVFLARMRELEEADPEGAEGALALALDLRDALAAHVNDADRKLAARAARGIERSAAGAGPR
jgi:hemerythrin